MDKRMEKGNGKRWGTQPTATAMRENTSKTKRMARGSSYGKVEISIRAVIRMMKGMDTERCFGLMGLSTRVSGNKGSSMGRVRWSFQMVP